MRYLIVLLVVVFAFPYCLHGYDSQGDKPTSQERTEQIDQQLEDLRNSIDFGLELETNTSPFGSANIVLLPSTVYRDADYFGDIRIRGELKNTGNAIASFVKIKYTFKNSSGNVIGIGSTYVYGPPKRLTYGPTDTTLSPSEIGAFELSTSIPNSNVASMSYTIVHENYATQPMVSNVRLYGTLTKQPDYSDDLELLGELKNHMGTIAYWTKFVATIKNSAGKVIDVGSGYVNGRMVTLKYGNTTDTAIYPGDTASFKIATFTPFADAASVTYKIQWDEGGVANKTPVCNAGPDQTVRAGKIVTLDGTQSYDPNDIITSYNWTQISGPKATLSNPKSSKPTFHTNFIGSNKEKLTFSLLVTNKAGLSSTDTVNIVFAQSYLPHLPLLLD